MWKRGGIEFSDNRGRLASPLEGKWAPRSGRNHMHAIHVTYRMCRPTLTLTATASRGRAGGLLGRCRVTRLGPKSGATGADK